MAGLELSPVNEKVCASLDLPGSKSIANRVLLLAALADGESRLKNIPRFGEDVQLMVNALRNLGIGVNEVAVLDEAIEYRIVGCKGSFPVGKAEIFCGNSGTLIRFLTAVLTFMQGEYTLVGVPRMYERPIADLVESLRGIGGQIDYLDKVGFPPIAIRPLKYNNRDVSIDGSISSQFLTALLIALPLLDKVKVIDVLGNLISKPYVDITLQLLKLFGIMVKNVDYKKFIVEGRTRLNPVDYIVEPDASSASYFLAFGALNGIITVNGLSNSSLQGDRKFALVLRHMGAQVEYFENSIRVASKSLYGITVNMEDMPDVAMTLAVLALFAVGDTVISGIKSWKVKETNRLEAMFNELSKLGAFVSITDDSIKISPPDEVRDNIIIDTYGDHRMAMCFSLVAAGGKKIIINDYECVGKTFANYFKFFGNLCELKYI